MKKKIKIVSESDKQTREIAEVLAKEILLSKINKVFLVGDLGSGKTTFTKGFLRGLGIKKNITSPTFVIAKNYILKNKKFKTATHIDCYRLSEKKSLEKAGVNFIDENIYLIEWPDAIKLATKNKIKICFKLGKNNNQRILEIS